MKPKEGCRMKRRIFGKKVYIILGILCCMFMWLQMGIESFAFTRTTGEVTGSTVKVRKEASTETDLVASVRKGDKVDVVDAITGADGKVWYKIMISATEYGYIRSDLVVLASGEQAPSNNNTATTTEEDTPTEITPMDEQKGHTSTNNVKVRKEATTNSAEVDRLNQDQIFIISGSAKAADGKTWYYVSYVDGGASKQGFIRSDLVKIMEPEEETEEVPENPEEVIVVPEEEEVKPNIPAPSVNYEAVYTPDENGNYVWYLYDKTAGQRYKIEQFLNAAKEKEAEIDELSSENFGLRLGLIISICLLIMLGVAIAFYVFKMREEAETEETTKDSRRVVTRPQNSVRTQSGTKTQSTTRVQSNVRPQTLAKPQTVAKTSGQTKPQMPAQEMGKAQVQDRVQATVKTQEQKSKLSWKAKNFLEDNDEFEFGFLDFDDEE